MIRRSSSVAVVAVLALAGFVVGDDSGVKSGIQVGGQVPAFYVKDITGPSQGKSLCYRCRYGKNPCVAVFARSMNDTTAKLIAEVDQIVGAKKDENLKGFVVFIAEDTDALEPKVAKLATEKKISATPLTVFKGVDGPDGYDIAKGADVTVLMWVGGEVKANLSFAPGKLEEKAITHLTEDVKKILAAK